MNKTLKEEFCPLCIAPIIAIAGGGIAGAGVMTKEEKKKQTKKILIWTGVSIVLTIAMWYAWIRWKGGCRTCKLP
jgi:hypothetical protein